MEEYIVTIRRIESTKDRFRVEYFEYIKEQQVQLQMSEVNNSPDKDLINSLMWKGIGLLIKKGGSFVELNSKDLEGRTN
jgi:hypothetical protein